VLHLLAFFESSCEDIDESIAFALSESPAKELFRDDRLASLLQGNKLSTDAI